MNPQQALILPESYPALLQGIKHRIHDSQVKAALAVNRELYTNALKSWGDATAESREGSRWILRSAEQRPEFEPGEAEATFYARKAGAAWAVDLGV